MRGEVDEFALQRGRIGSLMRCDEVGYRGLYLQCLQRSGHRLVVHRCEIKSSFELACFHVMDEGLAVGRALLRIADTMAPDTVEVGGNSVCQASEIGVEIPIAVGLED